MDAVVVGYVRFESGKEMHHLPGDHLAGETSHTVKSVRTSNVYVAEGRGGAAPLVACVMKRTYAVRPALRA